MKVKVMNWSKFVMGAVQRPIIGGYVIIFAALVVVACSIYLYWMVTENGIPCKEELSYTT